MVVVIINNESFVNSVYFLLFSLLSKIHRTYLYLQCNLVLKIERMKRKKKKKDNFDLKHEIIHIKILYLKNIYFFLNGVSNNKNQRF
jgi:hypothetical protein